MSNAGSRRALISILVITVIIGILIAIIAPKVTTADATMRDTLQGASEYAAARDNADAIIHASEAPTMASESESQDSTADTLAKMQASMASFDSLNAKAESLSESK